MQVSHQDGATRYIIMWIIPDTIITMAGEPLDAHALLVDGNRIADIIPVDQVPIDADKREFPGGIAFPAFVNMHTHLFWSGYRGIGDDLPLVDWIYKRLVPVMMKASDEDKTSSIETGIRRSYEAGITTVLDTHIDSDVFNIALQKSMRGIFFLEGFGIYSLSQNAEVKRCKQTVEAMLEIATDDIKAGFSPHAPYTVTTPILKKVVPWARELGLPIMTHLAETVDERMYFAERKGIFAEKLRLFPKKPDLKCSSPVDYYREYDLFGPDLFLVHCVDLTPDEVETIAGTGSKVVTCPTSNAKLGCGIAPITGMMESGIDVLLGTDSESSCDEFDMFEEMRRLILLQRASRRRVGDIETKIALEMCTSLAAVAAGFEDIGTIEIGKTADIVVATPNPEGVSDYRDAYGKIVWGTHKSDINIVMTRGKIVHEH